jgi:hypothetical protein
MRPRRVRLEAIRFSRSRAGRVKLCAVLLFPVITFAQDAVATLVCPLFGCLLRGAASL